MSTRRPVTLWTAACLALIGSLGWSPATAERVTLQDLLADAQAMPESVGIPLDSATRGVEMGRLQKALAGRQVERALARAVVVELEPDVLARIDRPGRAAGKYFVGVDEPLGLDVELPAGSALAKRSLDVAVGSVRGTGDGGILWSAALHVPGATALRAHLTGLDLPAGAKLYVYNLDGQAFGPYTGRGPLGSGELYTHTVFGDRLLLQLAHEGAAAVPALQIASVGVLGKRFALPRYGLAGVFDDDDLGAVAKASNLCSYNADCVVNAACTSTGAVADAKQAVATMLFASGGSFFICTGGLVADTDSSSVIPYFLTANHCIGSSGEASSLETYFDYTTTCNSPNCTQPYNNTGETVGATIKATSSSSDFSLLQLSSTPTSPDGITRYLGWLSTDISNSTTQLYRISHPQGAPQAYSEQRVDPTKTTCRTLPRGDFLYSKDNLGATEGGSSGSPVVNGAGQIVGQLYGACGFNLNDVCDADSNATVDGAFAATYPSVAAFLDPDTGGGGCSSAGASCSSNGDCCSNKCKGKPGAKTCK